MTVIGTFLRTPEGYTGAIRTLTLNAKVVLVPSEKTGARAPDFRLLAGDGAIGAAWRAKAKGEGGKDFLRVEFDDPSFAAPVRAALFENGEAGEGMLVWSRK